MITRRRFLQGLGGAAVALPVLESVKFTSSARAADPEQPPVYSVFVRQGNGCQQELASRGEPERFWPSQLGAITTESLTADSGRTVSELAAHADKLLMVRGTRFAFPGNNCGHSGGINQVLTAARVTGEGKDSLADGESIDWRIAQDCNPTGVDPLTLMAGPQQAYIAAGLSYSGPQQLRGAQSDPFSVYTDLVGLVGADPALLEELAARRTSVNDLVRQEMQDLLGQTNLSTDDRQRLETHFEAIRDLEVNMSCQLADGEVMAMETISQAAEDNANRIAVAEMHMNLIAFAFACNLNRTATLQIGTGNDSTRYYVDGTLQNTFHRISHRIDGDGSDGPPIPDADLLHHEIDRIFARMFRHLIERLEMYPGPGGGTLLDDSFALWTNDLSNGPPHSYNNIPQIIAGSAGGFLRTGQYIDAGGVTHNMFLNTLLSAAGLRNATNGYYDSFGDISLDRGVIPEMIA